MGEVPVRLEKPTPDSLGLKLQNGELSAGSEGKNQEQKGSHLLSGTPGGANPARHTCNNPGKLLVRHRASLT